MPTHAYRAAVLVAIVVAAACTTAPTPIPLADVRIDGYIRDTAWRPLAGVTVEATSGPGAGASTITDGNGQFTLTGKFSPVSVFRVHADGFQSATQSTIFPNGRGAIFLQLATVEPSVVITPGEYDISFAVAPPCDFLEHERVTPPGTRVPESLLQPTSYPATVRSVSPYQYVVTLHDPAYGGMGLGVAGRYVAVGDDWSTVTTLPDLTYLEFDGVAHANVDEPSPASFALDFMSQVWFCRLSSPMILQNGCYLTPSDQIVERSACSSQHHQIRFTRR